MDVRLLNPASTGVEVDVSEFLSLANSSPASPLMHTLQPLLSNATIEADAGIGSSNLEPLSAAEVSKPGTYDLLNSSGVSPIFPTSNGQGVGFVSTQSNLGSAAEISASCVSSLDDCSQYYIQCNPDMTNMKLDPTSSFGQVNFSAVGTLQSPLLVPSSSPHLAGDLLNVSSQLSVPTAQTLGSFRPAGVVDVSTPPKKPLSPYMRFSKGIWQQVKSANPSMSVCEVGATIGRMWREMSDVNKQHYNDDFALDKARYDSEMQQYLIANGLQPSDLSKSKKKKDNKEKSQAASARSGSTPAPALVTLTQEQMAEEMARTILESAGLCADPALLSNLTAGVDTSLGEDQLPSFSQVWSGADTVVSSQLGLGTDQMAGNTLSQSSGTSQPVTLSSFTGDGQLVANGDMSSGQLLAAGDDGTWLWQQYTADTQSSNQAAAGGASLANVSSLNEFILALDSQLEPGEIRPASAAASSQPAASSADTGSRHTWGGMGRDAAELALLRNALVARGKEAARLTRELELAYKLIEQLQQQNIAYQQLEWQYQAPGTNQMENSAASLIVSNAIN